MPHTADVECNRFYMTHTDLSEHHRLEALRSYGLLGTPPEKEFDCLTQLAARICETPIASLTLVDRDRQWFKSVIGVECRQTPRETGFSAHVVSAKAPLVIEDMLKEERFCSNPYVLGGPKLRFYAGVPLVTPQGFILGALAVMSGQPHNLRADQIDALQTLARSAMAEIERRRLAKLVEQPDIGSAVDALEQSEQRFRHLADSMPHIVWTAAADGTVDYANRAITEYAGLRKLDISTQNWKDVLHPDDLPPTIAAWRKAVHAGERFFTEYRIFCSAQNRYRWHAVQAEPARDSKGNILKWYGSAIDIHDSKEAHETMRSLETRLTKTLESITDAFFTLDRGWRFTYINREAERLFARPRHALLGKVIWEELRETVGSRFHREYLRAVRENCTVVVEDFSILLQRWVEAHAYPSDEGLAVHFRDITERKLATMESARINRALQLLSSCNQVAARAESEKQLTDEICRLIISVGGYRLAWIGYAEEDAFRSITPAAMAGGAEDVAYAGSLGLSWDEAAPGGQGPAGRTVRSGQASTIGNIEQDSAFSSWREAALQRGYRSGICLPLRNKSKTFGVLALYSAAEHACHPEEMKLLTELADNLAFYIESWRARERQRSMEAAVLKIAASVTAHTGTQFFEQLVRNLTEALGAHVGIVARLSDELPTHASTLVAYVDGRFRENFDYAVEGTPCERIAHESTWLISDKVTEHFPNAGMLAGLGARAYAGQRLDNSAGKPFALLFVLFREPIRQPDLVSSMLQIFAARAEAELERQEADTRIRDQAALLDKAQDAIIVRGLDQRVLFWNQSAVRVYGWTREEALGRSIDSLHFHDAALLRRLTDTLLEKGEWTGEVRHRRKDGTPLTVECRWTLVRDERGRPKSILAINTDITQRKADARKIYRLAFYDVLTGLPNRQLLNERVSHAIALSARGRNMSALLLIDLDNFKSLNDTLGHDKGDLLLKAAARRLAECVRQSDTVARFGGDEFMVLLEELGKEPAEAAARAEETSRHILQAFRQPFQTGGYQYQFTASLGVTLFDGSPISVEELLKQAELAMYQSKAAGRNTLYFFDPAMQARALARAAMEANLYQGIREKEFLLHYQPQLNAKGAVIGAEALIRWQRKERMISPAEFIPLAEETGLIEPIGQWVLETACLQLASWTAAPETAALNLSINVSARQFHHPDFVSQVRSALDRSGADPLRLKLELTESMLISDVEETVNKMNALKRIGIGFSLDDFGTGYSSLSYLRRLPLDQLKIDQAFIRNMLVDKDDETIALSILTLGKNLGLNVIAEGVETHEQWAFLIRHGCDGCQGYLFSKPVPIHHFSVFLRSRKLH